MQISLLALSPQLVKQRQSDYLQTLTQVLTSIFVLLKQKCIYMKSHEQNQTINSVSF